MRNLSEVSYDICCPALRFKESMVALVTNLKTKDPFYVRCVKPNEMKSPVRFNDERCLHQVRMVLSGTMDTPEMRTLFLSPRTVLACNLLPVPFTYQRTMQ